MSQWHVILKYLYLASMATKSHDQGSFGMPKACPVIHPTGTLPDSFLISHNSLISSKWHNIGTLFWATVYTGIDTGNSYVFSPFSFANLSSIVVLVQPESNRVITLKVSPEEVSMTVTTSKALSDHLLCCMNLGFCWSLCNMNCALSSLFSFSCQINFGVTCSKRDSYIKDLTCLIAHFSSLESTIFLSHWDIHGSTVFIHCCFIYLFLFSGRIIITRGLDDLANFPFWLDCLSTLLERIALGNSAVFTDFSL